MKKGIWFCCLLLIWCTGCNLWFEQTEAPGYKPLSSEGMLNLADGYRELYEELESADEERIFSVLEEIVEYIDEQGYAVIDEYGWLNLSHWEEIDVFCQEASKGAMASVDILVVNEDGKLHKYGLAAANGDFLVTETLISWIEGEPVITYTHEYEAKIWNYTEDGYLFFEEDLPEGYDGAPPQVGIRIKPLEECCLEMNRSYVWPLGYERNNLFLMDWSEKDVRNYEDEAEPGLWKNIDFYDLYECFYQMKYKAAPVKEAMVSCVEYEISEREFEEVIQTYLNIDTEIIRANAHYKEEKHTYRYRPRTMYDAVMAYGPYPEVVDCEELADGTVKLLVKAVWTRKMEDNAWLTELVVRPQADGYFQYVSNTVLKQSRYADTASVPWYTNRLTEIEWEQYAQMEQSASYERAENLKEDMLVSVPDEPYIAGYDLPIPEERKMEAEADCLSVMSLIEEIYLDMDRDDAMNVVITRETADKMLQEVKSTRNPSMASGYNLNMANHEVMEQFLDDVQKGQPGEVVVYEIHSGGGIDRKAFTYDGKDLYLLGTTAVWNMKNKAVINHTTYNRLKMWEYTEKGWFLYEYDLPELSDRVNGNDMFRVKPLNSAWRDLCQKYILPIGYQGNNLFCSNWSKDKLEELDYIGLFQYLYEIEYGEKPDANESKNGIPKETFETLITKYLPVTAKQLQQWCAYQPETHSYLWRSLGQMSYKINFFATSVPEIVDVNEMADGTAVLTMDAVCNLKGSDLVIRHELTVRFTENEGIQYLSNQVLGDGINRIPKYQYRMQD